MKTLILFFGVLITTSSYAFNFNSYYEEMKSKFLEMIGEESKSLRPEIELPPIPKVVSDAKSLDVYNKKGELYQQGEAFNKLSNEEKRKYRLAFIQELYLTVTGSAGEKETIVTALNILEKGGSREGVYRSVVLSPEYSSLEGFSETPSEDLIRFASQYGEKFLARNFNEAQMRRINLYGIKRVIVEKTLEVMDSFSPEGEDLHKWYAVLSADLRAKFPLLWSGKTRTQKSALYHKRWAKSVPVQQIKSEVIIKLHKVMNSLQR